MTVIIFIFVLAVLLGTGVLVFISICSMFASLAPSYRTYEKLADRYQGHFQAGILFRDPWLKFRHGDSNCVLNHGSRKVGYPAGMTRLTIDGHDPHVGLLVTTPTAEKGLPSRFGMQSVRLPAEFSGHDFKVQSNRPDEAALLFQGSALWKLRQLAYHVGQAGIEIRMDRGKLMITQCESLHEFQALDDFVRCGLELHHQFSLKAAPEIEFVKEDLVTIVEAVQCPICSDSIHDSMVVCVRCKTPHCLDCWQYNGRCSTFACGETRYLGAGIAGILAGDQESMS
ncbi:MAG: hypothetical protein MK108_09795 [Mariniblastus sp.]|nr:hypothetical protein [Mariniblastus sp.]